MLKSSSEHLPEQVEHGLPRPAPTIAEEQAIEQAAERHPLPDEAFPDDVGSVRSSGFSLKERVFNLRSLISFGLAFGLIALIFWQAEINIQETWALMLEANWWLMLAGFIFFYAIFPVRALRWRILLRSAGFEVDTPESRQRWAGIWPLSEFIALSWFANCVVPAKLGDAYRGYLIRKNGDASFSRTLGTIFAERIIDMVVLFGMLIVSGLLAFRGKINDTTEALFIVGILLTVVLVIGLMSMRYLSPLIRRALPRRFHDFYARFEEGTLASFRPRLFPALATLTIIIWLGEALRLYFVIYALGGFDLSLAAIIFVALASSLLTAVPALPGGLGLVEGGIFAIMSAFGVGLVASAAVALLDRVINYWSIIVFGFIDYVVSKRA